jgi:squalene synthase HpnC
MLDRFHRRAAQSVRFPRSHLVDKRIQVGARLTPPPGLRHRREVEAAQVAARARTENFPVASLLFPRALRPHLRAVYGFARLVDILGDEAEGDRLALLDELEREVAACYAGGPMSVARGRALPGRAADQPSWPVMRELQPTIREFGLPREPFLRLIECNRQDQRVSGYETWADLKQYCTLSADPVGRLVLGLLRRADDAELVAASDDVCTGLQLVNFLQDVPRDLELGRVYLPAEDRRRFAVTVLDRPNAPLTALLRFEADRARGLLAAGQTLRERIGGRIGRGVGLFARGGLAALAALEDAGWDIFTQRPRPSRLRLAREALRR